METYLINERPLTDDILYVGNFRGGYVAVLDYHTFRNSCSDDQHTRRFRTLRAADRFIRDRYGDEVADDLAIA